MLRSLGRGAPGAMACQVWVVGAFAAEPQALQCGVSNSSARQSSDDRVKDERAKLRRSGLRQRKMETTGILVIALVIIAITLARYWHTISWGLR